MKKNYLVLGLILACITCAICVCAIYTNNSIVFADSKNNPIYTNVNAIETDEQIDLYLKERLTLNQFFSAIPKEINIHDPEMLQVSGNTFIPQSEGITYISYVESAKNKDGKTIQVLKNRNVVIHEDTREVKGSSLLNKQDFYVGQSYSLNLTKSSECDNTQLKIQLSSDSILEGDATYCAEDFIELNKDKTSFKVVGVGNAQIKIQSRTNKFDPGITININSKIQDTDISASIKSIIKKETITKEELESVKTVSFSKLKQISESTILSICPNLNEIVYDLTNASSMSSDFSIGAGNGQIAYRFKNLKNVSTSSAYAIVSDQRDNLSLSFVDFNTQDRNVALDLSKASNVKLNFEGNCFLRGANVDVKSSRTYGLKAKNIEEMRLAKDAAVTISGGNGSSQNKATSRNGGIGVTAENICITADANSKLAIRGGNGGNGYSNGENGGNGGVALHASSILFAGEADILIQSGNGGNGANGAKGNDGSNGKNGEHESKEATSGTAGSKGGNGGNGGNAVYAAECENIIIKSTKPVVTMKVGKAGNGGNGGNGGKGGNGGNGDTYEIYTWVISWANDKGYNGGDGAVGGNGGNGGNAGVSLSSAISNESNVTGAFITILAEIATPGVGGKKGDAGIGGEAGKRRAMKFFGGWAGYDYFSKGNTPINTAVDGNSGILYYNNHKYSVISANVNNNIFLNWLKQYRFSWENAKTDAESKGGHLATITSIDESNALKQLVQTCGINVWIGASDKDKEGTWKWVTGEKFSYSNWASGEPNDANSNEDYVGIYYDSYTWNDYDNENSGVKGYILEIE